MPWKVVSIVWPAIVAALLPLDLAHVTARLPHIITRLAAQGSENRHTPDGDRSRPHQVDNFRSRYATPARRAA
jgi:hypothetical protein